MELEGDVTDPHLITLDRTGLDHGHGADHARVKCAEVLEGADLGIGATVIVMAQVVLVVRVVVTV